MASLIDTIVDKHPLVSDQVSKAQIRAILDELTLVIQQGRPGAIVEFGCYVGTTSLFIRRLLDELDPEREFHVYDSFAGLPEKTIEDNSRAGEQFVSGELSASKKQFLQHFQRANLKPPVIHKGWFRDLSSSDVPEQIALAFLDGDFYASIRDSLRLVLPRMAQNGVIIVDDYAREALPGAARAVHDTLPPEHHDSIKTVQNLGVIRL